MTGLVPNERDDHGVEVEEEHEKVEAELDERLLLMNVEFAEDFGRVEEVVFLEDSVAQRTYHVSQVRT